MGPSPKARPRHQLAYKPASGHPRLRHLGTFMLLKSLRHALINYGYYGRSDSLRTHIPNLLLFAPEALTMYELDSSIPASIKRTFLKTSSDLQPKRMRAFFSRPGLAMRPAKVLAERRHLAAVFVWIMFFWPTPALAALGSPGEAANAATSPFASGLEHRWAVAAQVGGALTLPSLDVAIDGARRWRGFGILAKVDWNRWVNTQKPPMLTRGTLNLGLGGEYWYFDRHVRAALMAGPSILLFRTALNRPGETGVFVDCYPFSLNWRLAGPFYTRFDPLSFHVIAPVLDTIPLVVIEYRTSIALEWRR